MIPGILDQAMTHIINSPDQWEQGQWFCGTAACLAGRICLLAGAQPIDPDRTDQYDSGMVVYGGEEVHASQLAQHLAGLTGWEAARLWGADNTMPELYQMANAIGLDLALSCWMPATDEHAGPAWLDDGFNAVIVVHRRTTAMARDGHWHIKHHPSRELAAAWASEQAQRFGYRPLTPDPSKDIPA